MGTTSLNKRFRPPTITLLSACILLMGTDIASGKDAPPGEGNPDNIAIDIAILKSQRIAATADGIQRLLRSLPSTPEQTQAIAELIQQLGSDDFNERESATAALLRLPIPPIDALKEAVTDHDPERSHRAKTLLKQLDGESRVQPLLFATSRIVIARNIDGLADDLKLSLPLCKNPVVKTAVQQAIRVRDGDQKIMLPAWTDLLDSYVVHGRVENTTTDFLKNLPSIAADQFKTETRTANTFNSVVSRHQTARWLYPLKGKGELPRILKEEHRHFYPIWGTWKQRYAGWFVLDENSRIIANAAAHTGPHYESQVKYLVVPVTK